MKKNRRILSIMLILVMIMTSAIMTVFATGEEGNVNNADNEESVAVDDYDFEEAEPSDAVTAEEPELDLVQEEAMNAEGEETAPTEEPAAPSKLDAVTNLKAVSLYGKKVKLTWKKSPNAAEYIIKYKAKGDDAYKSVTVNGKSKTISGLAYNTKYTFKVTATAPGYKKSDAAKVTCKTDRKIKHITYKFTMKMGVTLTPHAGKKKNLRLHAGDKIESYRFKSGKYVITRNKSTYYINRVRARNIKGVYTRKFNYTRTEAENFVNAKKLKSQTKQMIWVSTYTQHGYYFKKNSKGKWVCKRDWELATGKADAPTPTGIDGKVAIWKKISFRHGLRWWSCFSTYNAFHGKLNSWGLGKPASGGCVRNSVKDAKWVYNNVKMNSTVFIY